MSESKTKTEHQPSVWETLRSRGTLLVCLLLVQSLSGAVLGAFETLVQDHIIIALSLTMLVGAGGNASNQAAVAMIRALATGTVTRASAAAALGREACIGLGLALLLCLAGGARTAYSVYIAGGAEWDDAVAWRSVAAIALSLASVVLTSVIAGASLPLLLHAVSLDPAHAGPIVQVAMDIFGVGLTCVVCSSLLGGHASPHAEL
jgi:Mg/Co/Ni transporter MgtE